LKNKGGKEADKQRNHEQNMMISN